MFTHTTFISDADSKSLDAVHDLPGGDKASGILHEELHDLILLRCKSGALFLADKLVGCTVKAQIPVSENLRSYGRAAASECANSQEIPTS